LFSLEAAEVSEFSNYSSVDKSVTEGNWSMV